MHIHERNKRELTWHPEITKPSVGLLDIVTKSISSRIFFDAGQLTGPPGKVRLI